MITQTEKLNKYIQVLKKHLEEKEQTIIQLRKEVSELNYVNANKKWAELDG
jgi:hemerythrin-like domain-containing protein|tara:strand:+ start:133 stop:285 length:153 start_codon:yes stop_codon:yes gene_type:complete